MQAESGQLPSPTERLQSSSPCYASAPSISDFLNASRVALLKKNPKTQMSQRVSSTDTGALLPILQQPAGTPRPPCPAYDPSERDPRKRKHRPKFTTSRKWLTYNPSLLVDEKCLVQMWEKYPSYRDLMNSARRHLHRQDGSLDDRVRIAAMEAGIQPGSPRAADILVPRTKWERLRRKMDRLRRKWGLCLVGRKIASSRPPRAARKEQKVATALEGLEDVAESEDGDADTEDELPSVEVEE